MRYSTVFLDRDGVINHDSPNCIKSWAEFRFIPGSLEAIVRLSKSGIAVIIVTNQSMINRGMVPLEGLREMHTNLDREVRRNGGRLTDIFFCPHRPDEGCNCRKPAPGMLLAARRRHGMDLSNAVMVGDSARDIRAGRAAGCGQTILVRTGNGIAAATELAEEGIRPDRLDEDLAHAAAWILSNERSAP
ncbi:MAG: D-glycero-beta-D-manno-heptose-1,7-bisphosphate 7-phosphatase [Proteobacteria bacterium]|nr:MAG: D-glycero-beta-D-manno-heptose-1,7-bisphosphate 7-phosphatase [Pseudomonadota bacterium]